MVNGWVVSRTLYNMYIKLYLIMTDRPLYTADIFSALWAFTTIGLLEIHCDSFCSWYSRKEGKQSNNLSQVPNIPLDILGIVRLCKAKYSVHTCTGEIRIYFPVVRLMGI